MTAIKTSFSLAFFAVGVWRAKTRYLGPLLLFAAPYSAPSKMALLPFPNSRTSVLRRGVSHLSGNYAFVPPRQESGQMRLERDANWRGAVEGGGSMTDFFVREAK